MDSSISPPDSHHLAAAQGWAELGNNREARAEMACISPNLRLHPDVLETDWIILAGERDWANALVVAERLVDSAPERPSGWLHRAYALRRIPERGLEPAKDVLIRAAGMFPDEPVIPYNLACYACLLGHLDQARQWLILAVRKAGRPVIRKMALDDADLVTLWPEIRSWDTSSSD